MSQGSSHVPTTGPRSPTLEMGDVNTALDSIISKNSGNSAPANYPTTTGGGQTQFQDWNDTTDPNLVVEKEFDGSSNVPKGVLDTINHRWLPKIGGATALNTIASGATVDLGSLADAFVVITAGSLSVPISSFGSNAKLQVGESKFCRAAAAGQLTYGAASIITPGLSDLNFLPGSTWQAIYLGAAAGWLVFDFQDGAKPPGAGRTGTYFDMHGTGVVPGAVRANGRTIGDATSGATELASASTANLFIWLYLQDGNLAVSGGRTAPGNTRAAAITDYNAHKTITLPSVQNKVRVGLATMGGTDPHLMGGAKFTTGDKDTLGSIGGEAAHIVSAAESKPHDHAFKNPGNVWTPDAGTQIQSGAGSANTQRDPALKKMGTSAANSAGVAITVTSATPGVITYNGHNLAADQPFQFDFEPGGAVPTGTSLLTTYYVSAAGLGANTFQFSATPGGASINTTSTGTNVLLWTGHNNMPPFIEITVYIEL